LGAHHIEHTDRVNDMAAGSPAAQTDAERAIDLGLDLAWHQVDPDPQLVANGTKAFLLLGLNRPPDWQGAGPLLGSEVPFRPQPLAIVEFLGFYAVRGYGGPGEQTLTEHHLHGKGLAPNRAHQVVNSRWIAYEEHVDPLAPAVVGRPHHPLRDSLRHYLFTFPDQTLEFLAEGIAIERRIASQDQTLVELVGRLWLDAGERLPRSPDLRGPLPASD
jgi:hypothetical protein